MMSSTPASGTTTDTSESVATSSTPALAIVELSTTTGHEKSTSSTTLSSSSSPPTDFQSIITAPELSASTCSTIETEAIPSPWIDLQNMNFDRGLAGEFTIASLQYIVKKEKVRENLNSRYDKVPAVRGMIDRTRRITGGTIVVTIRMQRALRSRTVSFNRWYVKSLNRRLVKW